MASDSKDMVRNAATVAGLTLISRLLGFVRDMTTAYYLGAGPLADVFYAVFRLPNLARGLLAEGSMHAFLVPALARARVRGGAEAVRTLIRSLMVWALGVGGALSLGMTLFASDVAAWLSPGVQSDPGLTGLASRLVLLGAPYYALAFGTAVSAGALNAADRFFAPALGPAILNIAMLTLLVLAPSDTPSLTLWLAAGFTLGGLAQLAVQQPFLRRTGLRWIGPVRLGDRLIRRAGLDFLPGLIGSSSYQVCLVGATILGAWLPTGAVSGLYYADRLILLPLGVFGTAVGLAALPNLSALAADGERARFRRTLAQALSLSFFISVPAATGLCGVGEALIPALFGRGAFDAEAARTTTAALYALCSGLPALAAGRTLISAHYALGNVRLPAWTSLASVLICLISGLVLMGRMGHVGLALGVSLAAWANALLLGVGLRRDLNGWTSLAGTFLKAVALGVIGGLGAHLACRAWGGMGLLSIPAVIAFYFWSASRLGMPEAGTLLGVLPRRGHG